MDLNDPETWRWIWLVAALAFAFAEIGVAGTFFLAPFAVGAALASILAFAGVSVSIEWLVFVSVSAVSFLAFRPLARRLDAEGPALGIGSHRQISQRAKVLESIDGPHDSGVVLLGAERWRAESATGAPIAVGSTVVVVEVKGTRVIVSPVSDDPSGTVPPA